MAIISGTPGAGAETLIGRSVWLMLTDTILGLDGDDTLSGGLGNDTLDGGAGFDGASYYRYETLGITHIEVNLHTGTAIGRNAAGDILVNHTLISIERVLGTSGNDRIVACNETVFRETAADFPCWLSLSP